MLKIKKQLPFSSGLIDETEYNKNQEDIENSIKNLYIGNQSKKKTIDDYAKLTTQIREEYAKLQAKCVQLENTLQKYKDSIENRNRWQQPRQQMRKRPFRKTKIPYYQYDDQYPTDGDIEDSEEDNDYFTYESKSKPKRKKRIVYVDEIDGDETNEPEEVEVVEEEPEYVKVVKKKMPPLRKKNTKKERVGLTKSI